ncbi:uncharacterized protein LOC144439278 [Glandiceps talaboti]
MVRPVPKKSTVTCMNDLRPVALTSALMKVCERIVLKQLNSLVSNFTDPLQFAYRQNRSTDDAVLFALHRIYSHLDKAADHRSSVQTCPLIKFADDSAMIGLLDDDVDDINYLHQIDRFVAYCDQNHLILNVAKTKEMVIDFRKRRGDPSLVSIKGVEVARVDNYQYLGLGLDCKLNWQHHIDILSKKLNSRLYCLRKLRSFNVNQDILSLFYGAVINSVISYCIVCWGGNITQQNKRRLDKLISKAGNVIGKKQLKADEVLHERMTDKVLPIMRDETNPLRQEINVRRIDRSGRFRQLASRTTRYHNSFIPQAITLLNKTFNRN